MDALSPTPNDRVNLIAKRHSVEWSKVVYCPDQGMMNAVYFLGSTLVLRIPRSPTAVAVLEKESNVLPVARSVGVLVPELVEYDDSCRLIDRPYQIITRIHGVDLHSIGREPPEPLKAHQAVGRTLARLHTVRYSVAEHINGVPINSALDARALVERAASAGEINPAQARWMTDWFHKLDDLCPTDRQLVLTHGDVAPPNLIVEPSQGTLRALIDWGDAGWGDPANDFADVPIRAVIPILRGYRTELSASGRRSDERTANPTLEAQALRFQLALALAKLLRDTSSQADSRVWSAPRVARLFEILQFFASSPPEPWPGLAVK